MINSTQRGSNQDKSDRFEEFYRSMVTIRYFEEKVLGEFSSGQFLGTTHTYLGQEANAVGVLAELREDDIVVSNHRSHGHFLAYGGDMRALFAELMGKPTGVCGGRGGSQHLHWKNFYSNGVLGGTAPIAAGMAYAERISKKDTLTIIFLGDGSLGEGVVYESLNMASLWSVPILFVLENNNIAQSTPIESNLAGDIPGRFEAFGIETQEIDSSDVLQIQEMASQIFTRVRAEYRPQAMVIHTCRFGPHSKGDDTRSEEILLSMKEDRDPITIHASRLNPEKMREIDREVHEQVRQAFDAALSDH